MQNQHVQLPIEIQRVVQHEHTCRVFIAQLQQRGVKISVDPAELNHEQLIVVVERIYFQIQLQGMH